jgi:hypothetical protein
MPQRTSDGPRSSKLCAKYGSKTAIAHAEMGSALRHAQFIACYVDRDCNSIDADIASTQTAIDLSGKSDAHPHRRKSPRRTSVAGFAVKGVSGC